MNLPPDQCFEIIFNGQIICRTWTRIIERVDPILHREIPLGKPVLSIDTWHQWIANPKLGLSRRKTKDQIICSKDYVPYRYQSADSNGNGLTIRIGEKSVAVQKNDEQEFEREIAGIDFVIAGNGIGQMATLLRFAMTFAPAKNQFLILNPGDAQAFIYELKYENNDSLVTTNLKEKISLDSLGDIQSISFPVEEMTVRSANHPLPKWTIALGNKSPNHFGYQTPKKYTDVLDVQERMIKGKLRQFPATMVCPHDRAKCKYLAVFIGGSGNYDRHGKHDGMDIGYHRLLDQLALKGVASIRFDKVKDREFLADHDLSSYLDEVDKCFKTYDRDAEIKGLPRIVIGHSEGALIALEYAVRVEEIRGVVCVSGPAATLRTILKSQAHWMADQLKLTGNSTTHSIEVQESIFEYLDDDNPDDEAFPSYKNRRKYFKSIIDIDPLETLEKLKSWLLVVHGDNDVQVPVEHADNLVERALSIGLNTKKIVLKNHDHLLRVNKFTGLENISDYKSRRKKIRISSIERIARSILNFS
jgi:esterase/lipase